MQLQWIPKSHQVVGNINNYEYNGINRFGDILASIFGTVTFVGGETNLIEEWTSSISLEKYKTKRAATAMTEHYLDTEQAIEESLAEEEA